MTTIDYAREYLARGWRAIPLRAGTKQPATRGWPQLQVPPAEIEEYFTAVHNVGVVLGECSGWLVDVDLDCLEAIALAPRYLPWTGAVFGRPSAPRSHWLYHAPGLAPVKHSGPGGCIVEIRSTGQQTMFPGSAHPCGDRVEWALVGSPARVEAAQLTDRVLALAEACGSLKRGLADSAAGRVSDRGSFAGR